jgi:hypothetical protein
MSLRTLLVAGLGLGTLAFLGSQGARRRRRMAKAEGPVAGMSPEPGAAVSSAPGAHFPLEPDIAIGEGAPARTDLDDPTLGPPIGRGTTAD